MSDDQQTPVTFDAALAALEEIVHRLEAGDVGLEDAVALFEEGRRHLAVCQERLSSVEARIEELTAADLPGAVPAPADPRASPDTDS